MGGVPLTSLRSAFPLLTLTLSLGLTTLQGSASAQGAAAAPNTATTGAARTLQLPANYLVRFGSTQVVASSTDGFGVRYLPLPLEKDIRVTLLRNTFYDYWDYGLTARDGKLSGALGVFASIPKAELTYDQRDGVIGSALWQGRNYSGLDYHSHLYAGYSFTTDRNRIRILNTVGIAQQEDAKKVEVTTPYTRTEMTTAYSAKFGVANARLNTISRLYTYPMLGGVQASVDITPGVNLTLAPGLLIDASHLSRLVMGTSVIRDFNLADLQQSTVVATYKLPVSKPEPLATLGGVRGRVVRNWTGDYTYVYGDLFLRIDGLPTMLGPSVGYQWTPGGKTNKWLFSLVSLPR
ncbi:hypothetical protein GCM10008959_13720 [Deinococcus seoulensis]|uniref:DUF3187 family protein n=1 Tax=Deinococcus seoulensis TaxID=1837379 RepID=A0ABQ2RSZ0_9DEIO|nr:hypothetical protein GCM10008959_13720 [Deinococcus seoulensis]